MQPSGHLSRDDLVWLIPEVDVRLPRILDEVHQRFRTDWPDYADFLAREQDEVRGAAREFLRQLIEIVEQPDGDPARAHDTSPQTLLFEEIGRVQWREGRDLTTLLSAYQVGARVAWHHVSAVALEVGAPPDALAALAEAVFIFVDQLSSASARGYVWSRPKSRPRANICATNWSSCCCPAAPTNCRCAVPRAGPAGRCRVRPRSSWSIRTTRSASGC